MAPKSTVSQSHSVVQRTHSTGSNGTLKDPPGQDPPVLTRNFTGNPEHEERIQTLVSQLFKLADDNGNGSIDFTEFLVYHGKVMALANDGLAIDQDQVQEQFRIADVDNTQKLDHEEFADYMESVCNMVGRRGFEGLCNSLIADETKRQTKLAASRNQVASERLIEQAIAANAYKRPMKDTALKLLEDNADPNIADGDGCNVLCHMTGKIDVAFAKTLLKHGLDPSRPSRQFDCAIFRAVNGRHIDVLAAYLRVDVESPMERPLTTESKDETDQERRDRLSRELLRTMPEMSAASLKNLVSQKADINFRNEKGWSPLTWATFCNRRDCIEALCQLQDPMRGIKLQIQGKNSRGRAAIHLAARKDFPDIIKLLARNGADVDTTDTDGWTALHHACFNGNSKCVQELIRLNASLFIKGNGGMTPFLVTRMPQKAGSLDEETLKLLKLPEEADFAKKMLPILKDETLSVSDKIDALLSLPSILQNPKALRLHEWFFDPVHGPNKVRLEKMWTHLVHPLLTCIRTGSVGMDAVPGPHLSEAAKLEHLSEVERRRKAMKLFLEQWLEDTKGPPPSDSWNFDNRMSYSIEMHQVVDTELSHYRQELDEIYEKLKAEDGGDVLVASLPEEVLDRSRLTQLGAHPIPVWLQKFDLVEAFDQLRIVGCIRDKTDAGAVFEFVDLLTLHPLVRCGQSFWRNVYRLWLCHYSRAADFEFHQAAMSIVKQFNETAEEDNTGFTATYRRGPPKSFERTMQKEKELGYKPSASSYEGRCTAANILDVVRGTIAVNCPKAALMLLDKFRHLARLESKLTLVRIKNLYSERANVENLAGYRRIEMNVYMRCGVYPSACGREGKSLNISLVGELNIVLQDYLHVKKRRHLVFKLHRGLYDWGSRDIDSEDEEDEEQPMLAKRSRRNQALLEDDNA
eukprot:TRINITY_DN61612_c0_g1_i1.p1 TRINITY_DN61612_c0_g1~~TRINITY_DN61612_c0_g1_i1.p1  ORF type:complete len:926 (+),score=200.18 TRINITY_DN61612_c0_g1_i1:27-2780(+)